MKRDIEILILSDLHLGTYGSHATELLSYLKSVNPSTLVLNGDIIDIWQFKKSYFPKEHLEVLRYILKLASKNTKVYYLTGNHDDALRKFGEMTFGNISLRDKLHLKIKGKSALIFHGDVFDNTVGHRMRSLAILGGKSYDYLIRFNRFINKIRKLIGMDATSFSAKIKQKVKSASKHISDFEAKSIGLGIQSKSDWVICGHIHVPQIREVKTENGCITYLNSGDWVENLTALEYNKGVWSIYKYNPFDVIEASSRLSVKEPTTTNRAHVFEKEVYAHFLKI